VNPFYEQDGITIYCGDCREILPTLPKVDLVLTDPPYGISHKSHGQLFKDASPIDGDDDSSLIEWLDEFCLGDKTFVSFFSPYNPPQIKWRSVLIWDKGAHVGIGGDRETCWKRDAELIGVKGNQKLNGKRDSCVLRYNAVLPPPTGHFCEKPLPLMRYLVQKIPGETILDPFMGSGTTLLAAKLEGRKAIGIEINEAYCEIAANRLRQKVMYPPEMATL
jgi:DNA modification methylase